MSENNDLNTKPDMFRLVAYGLGTVIVLICAIIMATILVNKIKENQSGESVGLEYESVQELISVEFEVVSENESPDDTEEEVSVTESEQEKLVANWESLAAGTVIEAEDIDWNNLSQYFVTYEISDEVYNYINEKSFRENENVALSDLRYMKVLH